METIKHLKLEQAQAEEAYIEWQASKDYDNKETFLHFLSFVYADAIINLLEGK